MARREEMRVEPRVERYLRALVDEARTVLGEELAGVYAAGSVALDAFQPGRSDIDIALVCRSELPALSKDQLVQRLRHEVLECPARGLELVVYRREVAMSGTAEPGFELELNTGACMDFRVTLQPEDRPVEDGLFWYGVDRSILHQSGLPLLGPPASETFADLAPGDLRDLLVTSLRWWIALPTLSDDHPAPGAEDAVLGACRAPVRHRSQRWLPKGSTPGCGCSRTATSRPALSRNRSLLAPARRRRAVDARGCSSSKSWRRSQARAADVSRRTRRPGPKPTTFSTPIDSAASECIT
jgi:predicted nucleotidyltransferase